METQQAIAILKQAFDLATLKGVFNLTNDARNILSALDTIEIALMPRIKPQEAIKEPEPADAPQE